MSYILLPYSSDSKPQHPPPHSLPSQRPPSSRTGARAAAPRSRQQSTASMIIHSDTEDEGPPPPEPESAFTPQPEAGPSTRTRKAKDTQSRLGMGRPVLAGGEGARAATKPVSASKNKRGKGSRTLKPTGDIIPEEGMCLRQSVRIHSSMPVVYS